MSGTCALIRAKIARHIASARDATTREKVTTAAKAGFIGSIVTPMRAVAGNAAWGGLRALVLQPIEASADYALSVARSAATGGRVAPREFRQVASALDARGLHAMARGFREGVRPVRDAAAAVGGLRPGTDFGPRLRQFVQELGARLEADEVRGVRIGRTLDPAARVTYDSPVAQAVVDAAFTAAELVDRPFFRLAFESSIEAQAKLYAVRQGLKGAAAEAERARLVSHPTEEMLLRATDDAQFATFKDRGALAQVATGAKTAVKRVAETAPDPSASPYAQAAQASRQRGAKAADVALELNLPFTGVPSSAAARSAGMTPLGILALATDRTQAQIARTIAHTSVGAAGMWLGAQLFQEGRLTGPAPTDPNERAAWRAAGRTPFSVKVGDYWVSIAVLGPAAVPLFMGAAVAQLQQAEPDASVGDQVLTGAGTMGRYLTQQTYLSNVGRVVDALQDERKFPAVVASQVPTPSALGQLERTLDPYQREAHSLDERLLDRVPGGNALLPRALGPTGELPRKTAAERLAALVSPFPLSRDRDTPALRELRRLDVPLGMPSRTVTIDGRRVEIPAAEYRAMVQRFGDQAMPILERGIRHPRYQQITDEQRADWLRALIGDERAAARQPARDAALRALFGTDPRTAAGARR